jgi:hypothetical protein
VGRLRPTCVTGSDSNQWRNTTDHDYLALARGMLDRITGKQLPNVDAAVDLIAGSMLGASTSSQSRMSSRQVWTTPRKPTCSAAWAPESPRCSCTAPPATKTHGRGMDPVILARRPVPVGRPKAARRRNLPGRGPIRAPAGRDFLAPRGRRALLNPYSSRVPNARPTPTERDR